MDQVKEFLRQCVKYRFWISLSVAALFSIIAYFVGSGPVQAKAAQQTKLITTAEKDVKQYTSGNIPNGQYKPIVDEKTGVLSKDVNKAWKLLYERQAPLLTWPDTVQERFRKWGRKWPEGVADSAVEMAKDEYIVDYPKQVDAVYKVFKPFDYETGNGIVSSPPKEALLRPATFNPTKLPELGKIWSAQERLWVQRTVLEVIAQVNRNAKDWDSGVIKQINMLEVGNSVAQDQRSIAKGETLTEAPKIKAPGEPEEEAADTGAGGGMSGMAGMAGMMGMMRGKDGMGGMGGMMGGGMNTNTESVFYLGAGEEGAENTQYKILPILLSVLIDQDHVQDLLVELENSPMSIQVMDFELQRPQSRVTKPEKGTMANFGGMGMGYGGMMGQMMGMRGRMGEMGGMGMGYGGMMGQMMGMRGRMGEMGGMGMMGMGMGGGTTRQGTDKRSVNREEKREEETKSVEAAKGPSLFDPYFNIVEVKVYGQARFYNAPPEEPEAEPSLGETAGDAAAAPKGEPATPAPAGEAKAKAEPPKS